MFEVLTAILGTGAAFGALFSSESPVGTVMSAIRGCCSLATRSVTASPECKKQKVKTKKCILTAAKVDPAEVHTRVPGYDH